ncbi:MAG: L-threonylcarbamoyladenylate synthase [Actinomycetota bacterium]|nr:L-threonylcarbamoyladenylate synthase [Actinomycetota bacterium]
MRFTWFEVAGGVARASAEFAAERIPDHTLENVASIYSSGGVVALATDTVYGLSALVEGEGISKVFAAKGRPHDMALPVFAPSLDAALSLCDRGDTRAAERLKILGSEFWPGALTVVMTRISTFTADLGGSDLTSLGIRVPRGAVLTQLLERVGPFVATSANVHGQPPITGSVEFFRAENAQLVAHLDGLLCDDQPPIGTPSTVVDLRGSRVRILRHGAISEESIRRLLLRRAPSVA